MISLDTLINATRPKKKIQRVGRGVGSGRGKTSCRGHKGDKSRSGYKRRYGKEGGQLPLYRKLPCKGFTNGRFASQVCAINLGQIDKLFEDGEVVNITTLREKNFTGRRVLGGVKILSSGELKKKVTIEANLFSKEAIVKLDKTKVPYTVVGNS